MYLKLYANDSNVILVGWLCDTQLNPCGLDLGYLKLNKKKIFLNESHN